MDWSNKEVHKYISDALVRQKDAISELLCDQYGNYVIQKSLNVLKDNYLSEALRRIARSLHRLQFQPFGSKLYIKLTTNYPILRELELTEQHFNAPITSAMPTKKDLPTKKIKNKHLGGDHQGIGNLDKQNQNDTYLFNNNMNSISNYNLYPHNTMSNSNLMSNMGNMNIPKVGNYNESQQQKINYNQMTYSNTNINLPTYNHSSNYLPTNSNPRLANNYTMLSLEDQMKISNFNNNTNKVVSEEMKKKKRPDKQDMSLYNSNFFPQIMSNVQDNGTDKGNFKKKAKARANY